MTTIRNEDRERISVMSEELEELRGELKTYRESEEEANATRIADRLEIENLRQIIDARKDTSDVLSKQKM